MKRACAVLLGVSALLFASCARRVPDAAGDQPLLCATKTRYDGKDQLLTAVQALKLEAFAHEGFQVYHRGPRDAAEALAAPLAKAANDYFASDALRDLLPARNRVAFHLAILGQEDWKALRIEETFGEPFGSPFVTGTSNQLIVMPTGGAGVFSEYLLPKTRTDGLDRTLAEAGTTFDRARYRFTELVGFHELGHAIGTCLGLVEDGQHRWFGELVFTYVGTHWWQQNARPNDFALWNALMENAIDVFDPEVKFREVKDHDALLATPQTAATLGIENFFWYHAQFNRRGVALQKALGMDFVRRAAQFFAKNRAQAAPGFMAALDQEFPGFTAWAAAMRTPSSPTARTTP